MDIEAVCRYYVTCGLPFKKVYSKVKEVMTNKKFIDIINRVNYPPRVTGDKIKYFAAKRLIKNKLIVLFIIYAGIISKALEIKGEL